MTTTYRLGVDVGGTHTDLALLDMSSGTIAVEKVSTTPANPDLGIMRGIGNLAERGVDISSIDFFRTAQQSRSAGAFPGYRSCGSRSRFVIHLGTDKEHETPESGRYDLHAGERFFYKAQAAEVTAIGKTRPRVTRP